MRSTATRAISIDPVWIEEALTKSAIDGDHFIFLTHRTEVLGHMATWLERQDR